MNNTQDKSMECGPRQKWSLPEVGGRRPKSWRRRGMPRQAPLPFAVMPEHGRPGEQTIPFTAHSRDAKPTISRAMVAAFSLALLLFSCIGATGGITNTQATTADLLSASISTAKPTRTPPGRHSPTPTAPASPTAANTPPPAPTSTFAASPTTIPAMSANATPPLKVTIPPANQKQRGSPVPTPISTWPTPGTAQHTSYDQQKSEFPLFPVIIGTLSGIGGVTLLLAIGLLLLRKYLLPPAEVRLPPSGAAPWQRVRLDSLDDGDRLSVSDENTQTLPALDGRAPTSADMVPAARGSE